MKCSICECELTGGLDTFGPTNEPMCWDCFSSGNKEPEKQEPKSEAKPEVKNE